MDAALDRIGNVEPALKRDNNLIEQTEMELALKLVNCPFADVLWGINGETTHTDTFGNDRSRAGMRADYMLANPPYANFAQVQRCR